MPIPLAIALLLAVGVTIAAPPGRASDVVFYVLVIAVVCVAATVDIALCIYIVGALAKYI